MSPPQASKPTFRPAIDDEGMLDLTDLPTANHLANELAKEISTAIVRGARLRSNGYRSEALELIDESGLNGQSRLMLVGYMEYLREGRDPREFIDRKTARKYEVLVEQLEARLGGSRDAVEEVATGRPRRRGPRRRRSAQVEAPAADR